MSNTQMCIKQQVYLLFYTSVKFGLSCLLVFAELISSTLKMEAIYSSETSVETRRTTRRHIPENDTVQLTYCSLKINILNV
jgi:hypothetical protein